MNSIVRYLIIHFGRIPVVDARRHFGFGTQFTFLEMHTVKGVPEVLARYNKNKRSEYYILTGILVEKDLRPNQTVEITEVKPGEKILQKV